MNGKPPSSPAARGPIGHAAAERLARQQREAAALRENLRKRKEQARARSAGSPGSAYPAPDGRAPGSRAPGSDHDPSGADPQC